MKRVLLLLTCATSIWLAPSSNAQGTFQNLGFELANIPSDPGTFIPFTNALPNWIGYRGPYLATEALYNGVSLGFAEVSIIDRGSALYGINVIAGNFTVAVSAGLVGTGIVATAIAQTAIIPATAQSVIFYANFDGADVGDLAVTLNAQSMPFFQLSTGPNYAIYGGDVAAFAGMLTELRFTQRPISSANASVYLDFIQFSDQPIPEPSSVGLFGLGALLLGWRFRQRLKL